MSSIRIKTTDIVKAFLLFSDECEGKKSQKRAKNSNGYIIVDKRKRTGELFSLCNFTIVFTNKFHNNEKDNEVGKKNDCGRHLMSFYVWNFLFPFFKWLSHCHVVDLICRYIPSETILKPAEFELHCHRCDRSQIVCIHCCCNVFISFNARTYIPRKLGHWSRLTKHVFPVFPELAIVFFFFFQNYA